MESIAVSKTPDFGSYPNRPAIALWCNATRQALTLELRVQIPRGLRMGYSYNGYYARLLICEIRVQIPGSPLTPHLTKWIRSPHSQCGDTGSNPVGVIRAASAAINNGTWLSWSERLSDMQESGGSIPPVPTQKTFFFFLPLFSSSFSLFPYDRW